MCARTETGHTIATGSHIIQHASRAGERETHRRRRVRRRPVSYASKSLNQLAQIESEPWHAMGGGGFLVLIEFAKTCCNSTKCKQVKWRAKSILLAKHNIPI